MIKSYLIGLFTFIIIDTLWIKFFVLKLYIDLIPEILALSEKGLNARKEPALLFYFIFYSCLFYFCTEKIKSTKDSLITGATFRANDLFYIRSNKSHNYEAMGMAY